MSEIHTGERTTCTECGKPLSESEPGWTHRLFCSLKCLQLNQISGAVGRGSEARPAGSGGATTSKDKGQSGHTGGAPTRKPSPR